MADQPHIYLANLRLGSAFKDHNPPVATCMVIGNEKELYVVDDDTSKSSCFITPDSITLEKCFKADNPSGNDLALLPIDNCWIRGYPGGITDCALFNLKEFVFVEFKTNATGNTEKSVEKTYDKAISQLKNTYSLFETKLKSVGVDFRNKINVLMHVVVANRFPRVSAMEMDKRIEFFTDMGLPLSFDNHHTFA